MKLFTLTAIFAITTSGITRAQISRVIAGADYNYDTSSHVWVVVDSTTYTYTGAHGGDGFSDFIDFSTSTHYSYDTSAQMFSNNTLFQQTFDGNDNITSTTSQLWDTAHQAWMNSSKSQQWYDANNNDTLFLYSFWNSLSSQWVPAAHEHYDYVNNKQVLSTLQVYDTATHQYINAQKDSSLYTAGGNIASHIFINWDTAHNYWYYAFSNNWFYNAVGLDTGFIELNYDTTSHTWSTNFSAQNFFNPDSTRNFSIYFWSTTADTNEIELIGYDAHKNWALDEIIHYDGGAWDSAYKSIFTYNAYNQGTSLQRFKYANSAWVPSSASYYYYELYTSVPEVPANESELRLYPNPAANIVHVSATLPAQQPVQLSLYNLTGQQVWKLDMGTAKRIEAQVPVNNLPAGVYILTVNQNGYTQKRMVVVDR